MNGITRIGRYEVEKALGSGAMAVVYKAVDPLIGRVVAIKTIRLEGAGMGHEELRQRLYREAQSAGNLSHPSIVTIYDIGEEGNLAYIAMEFIEGETLQDWLSRNPIPPVEQTVALIEQIAAGLDYAAARGITHRDIKPGNILLTSDMRAKIADFGIAKFATSNFTQTGTIMGTPAYMSPEQAMGTTLDGRSDIFSLGAIFYEMLTGEKPFSGTNPTTIIYKILHEEPVPPRQLNVNLHPGLDHIVRRMLVKDPAQRYQTCSELAQDLKNYSSLPAPKPEGHAPPSVASATAAGRYRSKALIAVLAVAVGAVSLFVYQRLQPGATISQAPVVPPASTPAPPPPRPVVADAPKPAPVPNARLAGTQSGAPEKAAPAPEKPARAQVRFEFSGTNYPAAVYEGTRRLENITGSPLSLQVQAGDHRFRIVSEDVFLDRQLDRIRLKPDQVYVISLPGLSGAYVEVPNDAYDGCDILLNGRVLAKPYPAQVPKLAAGEQRVTFRWSSGKYAGKEFASTFTSQENHLYRVRGEPQDGRVVVQQVR